MKSEAAVFIGATVDGRQCGGADLICVKAGVTLGYGPKPVAGQTRTVLGLRPRLCDASDQGEKATTRMSCQLTPWLR